MNFNDILLEDSRDKWVKDLSGGQPSPYPSAEEQLERAKSIILDLIDIIDRHEFELQQLSEEIASTYEHYVYKTGPFADLDDDPTMGDGSIHAFYNACLANGISFELSPEQEHAENKKLLDKARARIRHLINSLVEETKSFGDDKFYLHEPLIRDRLFEDIKQSLIKTDP